MNGSNNADGLHDDSDRFDDDMIGDENVRQSGNANGRIVDFVLDLIKDLWDSSGVVIVNKLNWLLILGPIALIGDAFSLNETLCFAFSGLALIPCAERLSFVTEQVAEHTNGTIGALLNATFGNAPELLIASAALRKGYYRVVQLAMLGSMLTNLLFVFGISCLIGGFRWQVQELRITSGNVNVGMLLLSTAGSLLPATLVLGGQLKPDSTDGITVETDEELPSEAELQFCRVNAFIMIIMYGCYLVFQLGTHKEEFDEEENVVQTANAHELHLSPHFTSRHGRQQKARRNVFCIWLVRRTKCALNIGTESDVSMAEDGWMSSQALKAENETGGDVEMMYRDNHRLLSMIPSEHERDYDEDDSSSDEEGLLPQNNVMLHNGEDYFDDYEGDGKAAQESKKKKANGQRPNLPLGLAQPVEPVQRAPPPPAITPEIHHHAEADISFRVGILWLFIITLAVSAMSDILVDTIDGFARQVRLSEVFTSMVIVPFFSNVAEQVSAIIFAYRNEMDLVVGVTVGSAIQVAAFVLPGCVIIGWFVDRSMTLYFHAYETICLFLAVIVVAAVLQGGTTNWLVGATCMSVYFMIATGFWFHSLEDLSVDAETFGLNETRSLFFVE
eukprot:CAMPEP_0116134324 /NCGR_PEP_ID=MMETSP0329-20121206/10583_1 /TAXON_ID=697910 /ORGANISM="Pseudo-nitzschia arenysensis, Strain B593" /LENGTH=615 /DNA_ID=CAMNT_0003629023 /DNA_START=310 /DNA_END=2156 /DNA_ORIENTATION=-